MDGKYPFENSRLELRVKNHDAFHSEFLHRSFTVNIHHSGRLSSFCGSPSSAVYQNFTVEDPMPTIHTIRRNATTEYPLSEKVPFDSFPGFDSGGVHRVNEDLVPISVPGGRRTADPPSFGVITFDTGCGALNHCSGHGSCNYCMQVCRCFDGYGSDDDLRLIGSSFKDPTCASSAFLRLFGR